MGSNELSEFHVFEGGGIVSGLTALTKLYVSADLQRILMMAGVSIG